MCIGVLMRTDKKRRENWASVGKQGLSGRGAFGERVEDDIIRKESSCALLSLWVTMGDLQI